MTLCCRWQSSLGCKWKGVRWRFRPLPLAVVMALQMLLDCRVNLAAGCLSIHNERIIRRSHADFPAGSADGVVWIVIHGLPPRLSPVLRTLSSRLYQLPA